GTVGHGDPPVLRLEPFLSEFIPHRRILDAVLEDERIAAGAKPVKARRHGDRTGVTMIAKARANFFDSHPNVRRVSETVPREVHLVNIERVPVDPWPEGFASA